MLDIGRPNVDAGQATLPIGAAEYCTNVALLFVVLRLDAITIMN